jgi:hypothetical protein
VCNHQKTFDITQNLWIEKYIKYLDKRGFASFTSSLADKFFCRALISPWKPEDAITHFSALDK